MEYNRHKSELVQIWDQFLATQIPHAKISKLSILSMLFNTLGLF